MRESCYLLGFRKFWKVGSNIQMNAIANCFVVQLSCNYYLVNLSTFKFCSKLASKCQKLKVCHALGVLVLLEE